MPARYVTSAKIRQRVFSLPCLSGIAFIPIRKLMGWRTLKPSVTLFPTVSDSRLAAVPFQGVVQSLQSLAQIVQVSGFEEERLDLLYL